jgi:hypothetical protein
MFSAIEQQCKTYGGYAGIKYVNTDQSKLPRKNMDLERKYRLVKDEIELREFLKNNYTPQNRKAILKNSALAHKTDGELNAIINEIETIVNNTIAETDDSASLYNFYYQMPNKNHHDKTESWFLAETLKYFYLIFSEETKLPLFPIENTFSNMDGAETPEILTPGQYWVLNTECHPLKSWA